MVQFYLSCSVTLKCPHPDLDDLDSTKRMQHDHDAWLLELHEKIWNQKDRLQELFHTVEITTAHYDELQDCLDKLCPNRHTREYKACSKNVMSMSRGVQATGGGGSGGVGGGGIW